MINKIWVTEWVQWMTEAGWSHIAKWLQSCPTLCDPRDGSPPGSPVPGILQARTLEWVAISFSNAWKWQVKVKSLSHVDSWRHHGLQPTRLLRPWDFPGKSTGVGCHCLLQITYWGPSINDHIHSWARPFVMSWTLFSLASMPCCLTIGLVKLV